MPQDLESGRIWNCEQKLSHKRSSRTATYCQIAYIKGTENAVAIAHPRP